MKIIRYRVEKSKNGVMVGLSDTKGVHSQGKTLDELKKNLLNAAKLNGYFRVKLKRIFREDSDANQAKELRKLLRSRVHEGLAGNLSIKSISEILDEELTEDRD